MNETLFTTSSIIDLLSQIEELQEYEIGIAETPDGSIQLTIGDSVYDIDNETSTEVLVNNDVVEQVDNINKIAYEDLEETGDMQISYDDSQEDKEIEAGILKELAKTLLVGGLVRLTGKLLK